MRHCYVNENNEIKEEGISKQIAGEYLLLLCTFEIDVFIRKLRNMFRKAGILTKRNAVIQKYSHQLVK